MNERGGGSGSVGPTPSARAVKALLVGVALSSTVAFCQEAPDPAKLLGITYEQMRQAYPEDCKTLRAARYANEAKKGSLQSCEVKHHPKELVPGSKISKEVAFFKDQNLIELDFHLTGRTAALGLQQMYGDPDPPVKMDSHYAFGEATYGDDDSSVTLDGRGESHFNVRSWTRPRFRIMWQFSAYMSWDDMVQRDTTILGGLLIKPTASEKATFILRSEQAPPARSLALAESVKQAVVSNSEAAKSSPAAAALANVGHTRIHRSWPNWCRTAKLHGAPWSRRRQVQRFTWTATSWVSLR